MSWWMIVLLVLAAFVLIGCIPVGVDAGFDGDVRLAIKIGFLRVRILPSKPKKPKKQKKKQPAEKKPAQKPAAAPKKPLFSGDPQELRALLQLGVQTLGDLRRKLRVEVLTLFVYFGGGDDPAKNAIAYGRAWAVISSITPLLDQLFVIQKRRIEPRFAPQGDKLRVEGRIVLTITIGRALALGIRAGLGFLRIVSNKKKGDAEHEPPSV